MTTEKNDSEQKSKRKSPRFLSPEDRDDLVWFFTWSEDEMGRTPSLSVAFDLQPPADEAPAPASLKDEEEVQALLAKIREQALSSSQPMFDDVDADDVRVRVVSRHRRIARILVRVLEEHPQPAYSTLQSEAAGSTNLPAARLFDVRSSDKHQCCFCSEILEKDSVAVFYPDGMNLPPSEGKNRRWAFPVMAHRHCHDDAFKDDVAACVVAGMRSLSVGRRLVLRLYHAYVRPSLAFGLEEDRAGNVVEEKRGERTVNFLQGGRVVEVVRPDGRHSTSSWKVSDENVPGLVLIEGDGVRDERYRAELEEACNAFRNARRAVDKSKVPQNFVRNNSR